MGNYCFQQEKFQDPLEHKTLQKQSEIKKLKEEQEEFDDEYYYFTHLNSANTNRIEFDETANSKGVNIDDFTLLRILGKGSFGKVMLVEHKETKRQYALKVILKQNITNERQLRHQMTERYILEAMRCVYLVKLHYAFQNAHKLYLVCDYMAGGELFYFLRQYYRFGEKITQFYAAEIVCGLEYLHKYNIIYRDLKPENVLLDAYGHIKLADFGLSKMLIKLVDQIIYSIENREMSYSLCGTPEYIAPEIILQNGYDHSCDWWSFGAMVYEMLTGAPPFFSKDRKEIIRNIIKKPVPIPSYISDAARSLLQQLLVINPSKRLGSQNGAQDVKQHEFFEGINWKDVEQQLTVAPQQFIKAPNVDIFFKQIFIRKSISILISNQLNKQQRIPLQMILKLLCSLIRISAIRKCIEKKIQKTYFREGQTQINNLTIRDTSISKCLSNESILNIAPQKTNDDKQPNSSNKK